MVHVTGTSSILAFAALVAAAASSVEAVAFNCPGINYNIRAGADWASEEDKCKPSTQIASELEILKSVTSVLRLYSLTDCNQATTIVPAAIEAGFQLELGLWVDSYNTSYTAEKEAFAALLDTGVVTSDNIVGIHVGSEALYRGDVDYDTAVSHLSEIRQMCADNGAAGDIPLTITDVGNTYLQYPDLIDEVDYVSANLFPFWDSVVPAKSAAYFLSTYTRLVNLAATYDGDKSVVVGETGWPTNGTDSSGSEATPENAAEFFHDFYLQAQEQGITYYYFSAFDESWKGTDTVEAYFGLFYEDGELKPNIAELELDDEASASVSTAASSSVEEATADTLTASTAASATEEVVKVGTASEETDASTAAAEELAIKAAEEVVAGESTVTAETDAEGTAISSAGGETAFAAAEVVVTDASNVTDETNVEGTETSLDETDSTTEAMKTGITTSNKDCAMY
ncbi:hypothetical protein BBJ28_00014142 [Nothophytophthora sp. Chile5]|nr:hypothetical protein BBJ28_00014142 [Nothophytophthora sp. Chile5]